MLSVRGVSKSFRYRRVETRVLEDLGLEVERGELFVLLGPSGCGKTTSLRSIAGLERPDSGDITIDGEVVFSGAQRRFVAPEHRPISMVFQSYAVWPHMSVRENIAFPLREGVRRLAWPQVAERTEEVLGLLQLTAVADRPVTMLSGGQQQRVALARALALRPKVLLMDEPLSNLDAQLQLQLRGQIKALVAELGLTTVYVTHNQAEAMALGDRLAVMNGGRLAQLGSPREIYLHPRDEFVARFIGDMNLLPARVLDRAEALVRLDCAVGQMRARDCRGVDLPAGSACLPGIRPEDVRIVVDKAGPGGNQVRGRVASGQFLGDATIYTVAVRSIELRIKAHHSTSLQVGDEVILDLPPEHTTTILPSEPAEDCDGHDPDAGGIVSGDADREARDVPA